jgi:hypothetical protein
MAATTSLHGGATVRRCTVLVAVLFWLFWLFSSFSFYFNFIWWWIVMLSSVFFYGS